jgi:hypothetical protein
MGICQSYVEKKHQENLLILETLNKSIDNIRLLEMEETRKQDILIQKRKDIIQDIELKNYDLKNIKQKYSQTIETIKLFECKICMENLNNTVCVPCGHCFCENCGNNLNECPICRQHIDNIIPIYFN